MTVNDQILDADAAKQQAVDNLVNSLSEHLLAFQQQELDPAKVEAQLRALNDYANIGDTTSGQVLPADDANTQDGRVRLPRVAAEAEETERRRFLANEEERRRRMAEEGDKLKNPLARKREADGKPRPPELLTDEDDRKQPPNTWRKLADEADRRRRWMADEADKRRWLADDADKNHKRWLADEADKNHKRWLADEADKNHKRWLADENAVVHSAAKTAKAQNFLAAGGDRNDAVMGLPQIFGGAFILVAVIALAVFTGGRRKKTQVEDKDDAHYQLYM
ncbi:hypothetical protein Poli38472_012167 [Pythium oligandrum]|uniref:Uncharacterized protein n=1 Tax=Pythium oligandrum TaxID=41045 RepID=A0A8K1FLE6_PYTOL|nr:hypothetical protein Poli38472_012167 [Pythium oligandrum]|eukprot:TMW67051.1 hypothetical protein Poli38472_012167 [Pythium oligandrum]